MLMLRVDVVVCARVETITFAKTAVRNKFVPIPDTQQRSDITHVISQQFVICAKYKSFLEYWRRESLWVEIHRVEKPQIWLDQGHAGVYEKKLLSIAPALQH